MEIKRSRVSGAIRTEGGLLPADLLGRIVAGDEKVPGLTLADYGLEPDARFGEAITRSWNQLVGAWVAFSDARDAAGAGKRLTTETRERFLLPLFEELGFGRLSSARAVEIGGTSYPVSHAAYSVPIHLVGADVPLDKRTPGVRGAAGAAPHALVQELLNRSEERLWGFVSNGRTMRVLRDNSSLTRQAYLEFDLESIFTGQAYADFSLLWLVCHRSRFSGARHEDWIIERWTRLAADQGTRALESLRAGVTSAIETLGAGYLTATANGALRGRLRSGTLDKQDYYRQLLRLVYRLIFLFTAEDRRDESSDRELLLDPRADDAAVERYRRFYSTARLRSFAVRRRGTRHGDLWAMLRRVIEALGSEAGAPSIALPTLGSFLFSRDACPDLDAAELRNEDLLAAIRNLATIEEDRRLRTVDYANLGAEELGSVYESLLELHPRVEIEANPPVFSLSTAAGHERKVTGSYYTPSSLIDCLLDSALNPVLDKAATGANPEEAILRLSVVDPAVGSGHFLVSASHRIAKRLAAVRTGEGEPPPGAVRQALRDVISRCIYGVDLNPMAVELCKVSLWLEALEPGKPMTFLDAHIKSGNSLLGTTPELVEAGIPDEAYKPITGDDRPVARAWRNRNRKQREGQQTLFDAGLELPITELAQDAAGVDALADDDAHALRAKENRNRRYLGSDAFRRAKLAADAWCAAFVVPKTADAPEVTTSTVRALGSGSRVAPEVEARVADTARDFAFFHWPLEFPQVFAEGGFDVVLGNPPWIAHAGRAAVALPPPVHHFLVCTDSAFAGYRTTHGLFVHLGARLLALDGRLGLVVPTSIADLDGYRPARVSHDQLCRVIPPLTNFGDDAFPGVFMPCMALVSHRIAGGGEAPGEPWELERDDLDAAARALLLRLGGLPNLPSEMFGERGIQTTKELRAGITEDADAPDAFSIPIREGEDIRPFERRPPRLHGDPAVLGRALRSTDEYERVDILVRQTARYYIAAKGDGLPFRNSLLAVMCQRPWDAGFVLCLLNSRLLRWFHYNKNRDARQGMPQVKIGHLRAIPIPAKPDREIVAQMSTLGGRLSDANTGVNEDDQSSIDSLVFELYGIADSDRVLVREWSA